MIWALGLALGQEAGLRVAVARDGVDAVVQLSATEATGAFAHEERAGEVSLRWPRWCEADRGRISMDDGVVRVARHLDCGDRPVDGLDVVVERLPPDVASLAISWEDRDVLRYHPARTGERVTLDGLGARPRAEGWLGAEAGARDVARPLPAALALAVALAPASGRGIALIGLAGGVAAALAAPGQAVAPWLGEAALLALGWRWSREAAEARRGDAAIVALATAAIVAGGGAAEAAGRGAATFGLALALLGINAVLARGAAVGPLLAAPAAVALAALLSRAA